jgi:3'(2'), 5'-bisphosphate nucleotidase
MADANVASDTRRAQRTAIRVAQATGAVLLGIRDGLAQPDRDLGALRDAADRRAHETIVDALRRHFPDDPVLSEEAVDDRRRLASSRVWIVDPLDGTREFGEAGRTDWAVHVALAVDGEIEVAAVALPARDLVLGMGSPPPLGPRPERRLQVVVSRSRPPAEARRLASALGAELVPMGSAGAKAMAVVLGDADVYVHSGGQYEWDSAAPVGVALAAGLHASRVDGSPLRYNRPDPWLPDLMICRVELAEMVLAALA